MTRPASALKKGARPLKLAQPSQSPAVSERTRRAVRAAVRPDAWAETLGLRVDAKQFQTNSRPYMIAVMRDRSDEIVIKKAAQMGFTIGAIIKTLHNVAERKWNGLYLLPFKQGAITFVQARMDTIIESNPKLASVFHRVENRSHKQTGDGINLYIRGTNIATELREFPCDFEVWDERDKFIVNYLDDALARMDGSEVGKLMQLSTPTAPGIGVCSIDNWEASDQCKWEIPCPHCSRFQVLTVEDNVKLGDTYLDAVLECSYCHKKVTDRQRWESNQKGRWVPQYLDGRKRGYHISQLNSSTKRFEKLIKGWYDGQSDSVALRGFYTLGLGEPYAGHGDKFNEQILDDCIVRGHRLRQIPTSSIFVGVDVGSVLHVKSSYLSRGHRMAYDIRILRNFNELIKFFQSLHNFMAVIDAHPEKQKAKEVADQFKGRVWLGLEKDNPAQSEMAVFNQKDMTVSIDRTMAFDQYISDHQRGIYGYPIDIREIGEHMPKKNYNGFYAQHMEMVRTLLEDSKGNSIYRWVKTRNADHWHHTGMFESIAFQKNPPLSIPTGVSSAFGRAGSLAGA